MRTTNFVLVTVCFTLINSTCNTVLTPAGFWENYKKELLKKSISDQGPYGGHRAIYWKASNTNTFNPTDVIDFAHKNGWTLIDSSIFTDEQTNKWTYNNNAVFPLSSTGFSESTLNDTQIKNFPRWFGGEVKVYKFKTGWLLIDPGTDNSIEENGFVVMKDDGTAMAAYHFWGE
jgi:hypothetical protein